jgi:hypothetical protein
LAILARLELAGYFRAVRLLLGYTKVGSTMRYLGVELEHTLSIAERIDIKTKLAGSQGRSPIQTRPFNFPHQSAGLSLLYPFDRMQRRSVSSRMSEHFQKRTVGILKV